MKCEAIDVMDRGYDWDDKTDNKAGSWNGKLVQAQAADASMQNVYLNANVVAANQGSNTSAHIYLIDDTHGNDSYNSPSSSSDNESSSSNHVYYQGDSKVDRNGNARVELEAGFSRQQSNSDGSGNKFSAGVQGGVDNKGNASGGVYVRQEWDW